MTWSGFGYTYWLKVSIDWLKIMGQPITIDLAYFFTGNFLIGLGPGKQTSNVLLLCALELLSYTCLPSQFLSIANFFCNIVDWTKFFRQGVKNE